MAAAFMASSCASTVGKDLVLSIEQPNSNPAICTSWFGSNHVKYQYHFVSPKSRLSYTLSTVIPKASATALEGEIYQEKDDIPVPKVIIDQDSDLDATVVKITFGDRLGALLDTMRALTNLGLKVVKANVHLDSAGKHTKFAITKASTGRKVEDAEMLEAIHLTVISNLLEYHPESSAQLAMGEAFGIEAPDRPGLLVDLVKIFTDVNVAVESGEFDTEGLLAKAKFHVNYNGKSLIEPLQQVLANSLRYFLRRPTTEDSSF